MSRFIATACAPFRPPPLDFFLKNDPLVSHLESQTICSRPQALEEAWETELAPQEWEVWQKVVASAIILLGVSMGRTYF
jgi:hypothetical protein